MIYQRPLKRHFKVHIDIQNETQPADLGDMHGVQAGIMICIMSIRHSCRIFKIQWQEDQPTKFVKQA